MKKIILILSVIFAIFTLSSSLCYSRKCDKYKDAIRRRVAGATNDVAWRDFSVKHKEIDGKNTQLIVVVTVIVIWLILKQAKLSFLKIRKVNKK